MLTSSNQYLRPDYLSPLPTTLDAKKSPLALLAQTCSAIGADTPNPKLISAAEKASKKYDEKPHATQAPDGKPGFKPYESCLTAREKTGTPEDRESVGAPSKTPSSKGGATSAQARCGGDHGSSSHRTSPPAARKTPSEKSDERASPLRESPAPARSRSDSPGGPPAPGSPHPSAAATPGADRKERSSFKPSGALASPAFLGALPAAGFSLPMDLMTSGLMAAQHHALKSGLNPYLAYARMKAPGSELGACRDPYCTGCSLSSHLLKSACPAGCAQCDHAKPFHLSSGAVGAAYAHAQLAALAAASQLPFVCSWLAGDAAYCGKRFASSEELLQHLRAHTAGGSEPARSFPTPPLSPLTPRFHPYSKPTQLVPSPPLPFPLPPPASLAAYFPSYPLFGPRPLHP